MDEKKVISIEERIPKLKEARRKKTNKRLVFYLLLFCSLISIVIYLQSPLSYIRNIEVIGNQYVLEETIVAYSELSDQSNIWGFRTADVAVKISSHRELKDVEVVRKYPNTIEITIEELAKVAYLNKGEDFHPVLENGEMLESFRIVNWQGDAPLLYNFTEEEYLHGLIEELVALPAVIAALISEIYWEPTDSNPNHLILYMNDGYQVETSIRNFANSLKNYPSIASQLEEEQLGIIRIEQGGAVFDPYRIEEAEVSEEDEDETDG
jgi:cell division protein FtsQ